MSIYTLNMMHIRQSQLASRKSHEYIVAKSEQLIVAKELMHGAQAM